MLCPCNRRRGMSGRYSGVGIFSYKIKCGECGGWYGSKVWHSTDKYRKVIYRCNNKFSGDRKCGTPHLTEDEIRGLFVKAVNKAIPEKGELIGNAKVMMQTVCGTSALEREREELESELDVLAGMMGNTIAENASVAINQEEYQKRYNALLHKYEETKSRHEEVEAGIASRQAQAEQFRDFISTMEKMDGVCDSFDGGIWGSLVDYVTVYPKKDIRFTFKGGLEISV